MTERYAVRCLALDPPRYEWVRAGTLGTPASGTAEECAAALAGAPAVVLLDAIAVRLMTAKVPGRSPRVVAQAVPFAIEDELAEDVEKLHFAIGPGEPGGARAVAVVQRDLIERSMAPLLGAGVWCESALPETLAVPTSAPNWTLWCEGERVIVREGACAGFGIDLGAAPRLLARRLAENAPPGITYLEGPGGGLPRAVREACGTVPLTARPETATGLALLAANLPERPVLDLLPEAWRRREQRPQTRRLYRLAAGIAGLAAVLHVGLTGFEVAQLERRLGQLKAAETAAFHRAFPDVQRLVEGALRVQAEQELARLRSQRRPAASFLDLLAASARTLQEQRALGVSLRGFTYGDGYLTLRLETPDVAVLEQYRQALGGGVTAEVVSAESGEHGVTGTLRLHEGGS